MSKLSMSNGIGSARRWRFGTGRRKAVARRWQFLRAELARTAHLTAHRIAQRRATAAGHCRPYWWDAPTMAYPQVGRAGWLTLGQAWRANGGRWDAELASTAAIFTTMGHRPHLAAPVPGSSSLLRRE